MKNKIKAMLVSIVAVLWFGVLFQTSEPSRLLNVCWADDGDAIFDGVCLIPQRLVWPRASIPLSLNCSEFYDIYCEKAVLDIEATVGCDIFEQTDNFEEADVRLYMGAIYMYAPEHPLATTRFRRDLNGRVQASIEIHAPFFIDRMLMNVWRHELGHALGLEHDNILGSIMLPTVDNITESFTRTDLDLLNSLYCPEEG